MHALLSALPMTGFARFDIIETHSSVRRAVFGTVSRSPSSLPSRELPDLACYQPPWIDLARLWLDREEHGAVEAVFGQDLAQLRQRFFAAILLVAGNQHHMFALTGPRLCREGKWMFDHPEPACY